MSLEKETNTYFVVIAFGIAVPVNCAHDSSECLPRNPACRTSSGQSPYDSLSMGLMLQPEGQDEHR